ncbi:MAG: selenide, water dikinase SelD [Alphaproteobacteria bacterium]|nr:selenide, water dikinase SelD [Alphaproteobacteria bacterium]
MMPAPAPVRTDILLIGGGHAHVEVLRRFAMLPVPGLRLTLATRDLATPYSGMLPGLVAGAYSHEEAHVDLAPLAAFAGARLVHGAVTGLDLDRNEALIDGRPPLAFDLVSLDIGSAPSPAGIEGAEHALPVKPVDRFLECWAAVEDRAVEAGGRFRLVTVGAGAGGVELTLALKRRLAARLAERGMSAEGLQLTVVSDMNEVLPAYGRAARRRIEAALHRCGIEPRTGVRVAAVAPDGAVTETGEMLPADAVVLATPAAPAGWVAASGLAVDERGFVKVGRDLCSLSHPQVFAAGDIAAFGARALPKSGVFAVRQGPVLAENLRRLATGSGSLRPYKPQKRTLALISTESGQAVASWGPFAAAGGWAWRWKDRIDRRWMDRYRDLPAMPGAEDMRCGGCGAKLPADPLARVLARLEVAPREDVALGLGDDAAVVRPPPGRVAVRTADQFRAFIDDPWLFGRIAANHALGDLYAMGAEPQTALALATLPHAPDDKLERDLEALLRGALEVLDDAGCALVGGHTAEGAELALGFALDGHGREDRLTGKDGLEAGDRLVLAKPLGTGAILAAHMAGRCRGAWLGAALAAMQQSNRGAGEAFRAHGAVAVTDVTGFGLAGHLGEMLRASGRAAALWPGALPVLPGARDLIARGIRSTLHPANEAAAEAFDPEDCPVLFDPQTAGGLLAGVPRDRAADCLAALAAAGYAQAAVVGEVLPGPPGELSLSAEAAVQRPGCGTTRR